LLAIVPVLLVTATTGGSLGGFCIGFFQSQYRRKTERIETIYEATPKLMATHTREDVCDRAASIAAEGLDTSLTGVWLVNDEGMALEPVASTPGEWNSSVSIPSSSRTTVSPEMYSRRERPVTFQM
jgi:DNA integrity scanning protein DisA with diadenylate cyclase activity